MSLLVNQIEKEIEDFTKESVYLIEVIIGGSSKTPKITVVIDADTGVTIEECTKISRKLNKYLGEQVYPEGNYTLEITSPGADKPIKINRQYKKNIGRKLKLNLEGDQTLEATLTAVDDEGITVHYETIEKIANKKVKNSIDKKIIYSEIKKANVIITL
ncbi:MAG: hypothetical protein U0V72_14920 [Cytophagales bacterium]